MSVLSAAAYGYVGMKLSGRSGTLDDRFALRAFSFWWIGLAILSLSAALQNVLWVVGIYDPLVYVSASYLTIAVLCATVWGLFYYLGYLFSGRKELKWWSAALYALTYATFVVLLTFSRPEAASASAWDIRLELAATLSPAVTLAALGLLIVPVLLGVFAYGSLYFRVHTPAQRYRIAVVSLALFLWFAGPIGAQIAGVATNPFWEVASRAIGLLAALAILVAYRPPAGIARRLEAAPPRGEVWDG